MEINIFELDGLFRRMHAYLALACDSELGEAGARGQHAEVQADAERDCNVDAE